MLLLLRESRDVHSDQYIPGYGQREPLSEDGDLDCIMSTSIDGGAAQHRRRHLSQASVESQSPRAKPFLDSPQAMFQLAGVSCVFGDANILA